MSSNRNYDFLVCLACPRRPPAAAALEGGGLPTIVSVVSLAPRREGYARRRSNGFALALRRYSRMTRTQLPCPFAPSSHMPANPNEPCPLTTLFSSDHRSSYFSLATRAWASRVACCASARTPSRRPLLPRSASTSRSGPSSSTASGSSCRSGTRRVKSVSAPLPPPTTAVPWASCSSTMSQTRDPSKVRARYAFLLCPTRTHRHGPHPCLQSTHHAGSRDQE